MNNQKLIEQGKKLMRQSAMSTDQDELINRLLERFPELLDALEQADKHIQKIEAEKGMLKMGFKEKE